MSFRNFFVAIIKYSLLVASLMVVGALSTFLTLRFFTSGDEVIVPDLTGQDPVRAIKILEQEGLQLKILPQKRYSDQVQADRIVAQKQAPKSKIKQGRSIEVYLSLGPEKAIVPELTGQTTRVATMTLEQQGLQQGKIIYVSSPDAVPDQILAQYPVSGTVLTGNRTVNLLVNNSMASVGIYVMPDVIGKQVSFVETYFRSAGLRVGLTQAVEYQGIEPGTVVKQTPPAGYKVSTDTLIGLYYSK